MAIDCHLPKEISEELNMVKVFIKRILLLAAGYCGFLNLLRFLNRKKIVIFMLHGIVEEKDYSWQTMRKQCSLTRFEKILSLLQNYFTFISMDEAVAMLSGEKPIKPYSVVLTFDDGYKNNFRTALPVLKKYGVPAVFFIPTGHITNQKPLWFDFLDYTVQCGQQSSFQLSIGDSNLTFARGDKQRLANQFRNFLYIYNKQIQANDFDFQEDVFAQLYHVQTNTDEDVATMFGLDERVALMSWDEIKSAQTQGITIGSHTVDHLKLATLEDRQIEQQLQQSKADIEKHCSVPCKYLCYPNGNFDDRVVRIAEESGYRAAVTTVSKLNEVGDNIFQLSRIGFPRRAEKFHFFHHIYGG